MPRVNVSASLGNLWKNWDVADLSFLDGTHGLGTKQKPYQIRTKHQLMGLSFLAAFGMQPDYGEVEEEIVGDYRGAWFELTANIDLGGMDWNPIGYYRDDSEFSGEVTHPFTANLDGNGYKISNFRFAGGSSPNVGFLVYWMGRRSGNLTLEPGKSVKGVRQVGILAGNAKDSKIFNCQVKGDVEGTGAVGGMIGRMEGSTVENGTAQVTVRTTGRAAGAQALAGGIAGEAADDSRIIDCRHPHRGQQYPREFRGTDATVGGIVGLQNGADLYDTYVNGTIGGSGSQNVGGLVGERISGHLKVGRFEGTIGQSGTGAAGHRGTFIGYRAPANYFKYGDDIAYLFADTEAKIANNVCGSGISDDNQYTYAAHIGYSTRRTISSRWYLAASRGIWKIDIFMKSWNRGFSRLWMKSWAGRWMRSRSGMILTILHQMMRDAHPWLSDYDSADRYRLQWNELLRCGSAGSTGKWRVLPDTR